MKHEKLTLVERTWGLLRGETHLVLMVASFGMVVSVMSLSVPIAVKSLVDTLAFGSLTQQLLLLSAVLIIVLFFSGFLNLAQFFAVELLQRRLFVRVAFDLALRTPRFAWEGLKGPYGGELLTPFLEIAIVKKSVSDILIGGLRLALQVIVGLVLLGFYHPALLIFALILAAIIGLILCLPVPFGIRTADNECNAKYDILDWLEDLAHGSLIFRNKSGLQFAHKETDSVVQKWIGARRKHFHVLFLQTAISFGVHALASGVLLGLGGFLVIRGELSLGQLVAAEFVVNAALSGLTKFNKQIESFYDFCAASKKLHSLRSIPLERPDGDQVDWDEENPASLEIKSLHAGEDALKQGFLKELDLKINAGERVAICGQNGCGKSLLAELIFGLTNPTLGDMYIDGINVRDISLVSLRTRATLVRGPEFFNGTLEDNLMAGNSTVSRQDIRRGLKLLKLDEKMKDFNIDLQTHITPTSKMFSYGEMLRLSIARAILKKPGLLILDQTLDAIDEDSLRDVLSVLLDRELQCSVLALTHDMEIAKQFESAYELNTGKLKKLF